MQLLGDCDVIVPELCRRLGWELVHEQLPNGTSAGQPGDEPCEFVEPNFHLFYGAILEDDGSDKESDNEQSESPAPSALEENSIKESNIDGELVSADSPITATLDDQVSGNQEAITDCNKDGE